MAELSLGKLKRGESPDSHAPSPRETAYTPHPDSASDLPVTLETELAEIAAAQRDPQAFAPIYERYVDLVYRYTPCANCATPTGPRTRQPPSSPAPSPHCPPSCHNDAPMTAARFAAG